MANIYEQLDFSCSMEPIIRAIQTDMQTKMENEILKACRSVGIEVDKERLVQALTDARKFSEEGYRAGYKQGFAKGFSEGQLTVLDPVYRTMKYGGDLNE